MLMAAQYYLLTSLPALPALGEKPPVALAALHERAAEDADPKVAAIVAAVLLEHDLLQRQSVLAGERDHAEPVILTALQADGEEPLPPYLLGRESAAGERRIGDDALWEAYFRHVADVASATGSRFLAEWVGFEVALRNALVAARAKNLGLLADEYVVAPDLAAPDADMEATVAAWAGSGDPLSALRALDRGRWDWLAARGPWFTFGPDEVAVYARRLVLLHRWSELSETR
ncbi:MAG: hypothetical protein GX591_08300 [Planctomycetes bacterium]|nr:hypothetical protein [Planctomycetota bacterium]